MERSLKFISILMVLFFVSLPLVSQALTNDGGDGVLSKDPGSELWRNVRQRNSPLAGSSQVKSPEANILINISGEAWRQYRTLSLIPRASIALLVALIGVFLFRIIRGKIKIQDGRSGIKILRFSLNQRVAHWSTAILFVLLSISGLILLLGRSLLIPLMGPEAFSYIVSATRTLHNYLGPAFAVALIFLFVLFIRGNKITPKQDLQWIMKGGGLFGKHASSGCYNAGEKGWFWIAVAVGSAIVGSGLILDFPIFEQSRATMEFYLWVHGIAALIMIIASFGHIYMGTAAMEGAFEVMQTGYCDTNWAKEHHDLWYENVKDSGGESLPQAQSDGASQGIQKESTDNA